jgi:diguanylate cyclase (GGDEF)-like protein
LAVDRDDVDPQVASPSMIERTLRSGRANLCNDLRSTQSPVAHRQLLLDHGCSSLATLPVLVDGTAVGVITLLSDQADVFDDAELEVLLELAANLGFALQFLEKDEAVHFLSYFDSLTGLAKRVLFCQRLAQALDAGDAETPPSLQLVVFDIQKLGAVNDSFGRHVGDRLIENVAARLKVAYGDPEKLAHLGGGTFAIALPNISNGGDVGPLLQYSIGRLFLEPVHIDGHAICPTMRYGVAIYPDDTDGADALVQYAEAALAAARESNERYLSYPSIAHRPTTRSFALESRLAGALQRDEFLLHYQPKLNLSTGAIEGFEALLRWQDAEGLVPPSVFIPLLERSGAIIDVWAWVLLQAAHDIHVWRDAGLPDIRVAVNVSPLQLRRRDFATQVLSCIGSSGGGAGIDIEITESMLMQDIELSTRKLAELREAGVGVAIDDFGTGYSSLRLLSGLPISILKIDRSFVQKGCESQGGLTLVSTIISLARSFRMKTVAEGVETAEQLRMLRGLDCDQAQGFYFARPAPATQVPEIVARLTDDPMLT